MINININNFIFILFVFIIIFHNSYSQPDTVWTKKYGGNDPDRFLYLDQTLDSNYIIAGYTCSYGDGNANPWLVKCDSKGDTLWTKTYGGIYSFAEFVKQSSEGGYIIGGNHYNRKIWLIKTDSLGNVEWEKILNPDSMYYGFSMIETYDKGFMLLTNSDTQENEQDISLIKTDSLGNILWSKNYGNLNYNQGNSIIQAYNGEYIIVGYTRSDSEGNTDALLIKTNINGDTIMTKTYDIDNYESFTKISETSDNEYIITGLQEGIGKGFWLVKINSSGDTLWTRSFPLGSKYSEETRVKVIEQTLDKGYLILGNIADELFDSGWYGWLLKTNSEGDSSWLKIFDFNNTIDVRSMKLINDNDLIIVGAANIDGLVMKLSGSINNSITSEKNKIPLSYVLHQNYPNPFNPITNISYTIQNSNYVTMKIYNILGQEIQSLVNEFQKKGDYIVRFNVQNLSSGIYFYKLQVGNDYVKTKKMVLIR